MNIHEERVNSNSLIFSANKACPGLLLTLVMLMFLCSTLLSNFYFVNLQHSSCKHLFSIRVEKCGF